MTDFPQLKNPPIVEAQLNFQADASGAWEERGTKEGVARIFKSHQEIHPLQQFVVQPGDIETSITSAVAGYFLRKTGDSVVYQVRRDGFAFSRLQPYEGWESLVRPGLASWERFQEIMRPGELHGVSLRFINRLEVPRDEFVENRDRFLTIAPRLPSSPEGLPHGPPWGFASFAHHSVFHPAESPFQIAVLISRAATDFPAEITAIMLDITVSPIPGVQPEAGRLEKWLLEMRNLKNQAFFSITTEYCRRRYTQ